MNSIYKIFGGLLSSVIVLSMTGCIPEAGVMVYSGEGEMSIESVTVAENALDKRNNNNLNTRAGGISPDEFVLTITELSTGMEVYRSTVAAADKLYTLPSGEYSLEIASPWQVKDFAWSDDEDGAFGYRTVRNFTIAQGKTTSLGTIECAVSNVVVSVALGENMKKLSEGLNWKVSVGVGSLIPGAEFDFGPQTDGKLLCFRAENELNTLVWDFDGSIYSYPPIDKNSTIPVGGHAFIKGVKAGEHRVLTFDVTGKGNAQTGDFEVVAECETYQIGLDVEAEEEIIGALPVEIKLPDGAKWMFDTPADEPNKVFYSDIFDKEGAVATPVAMTVLAPKGIAGLSLTFATDNTELGAELEARGLDGVVDLMVTNEALTQLGLPCEVGGAKELAIDLTKVVKLALDTFGLDGRGSLDVMIWATAPSGEEMTRTLAMTVIENSQAVLSIEGVGFDIKERMIITAEEQYSAQVKVNIVATQGIKEMWVGISSTSKSFNGAFGDDGKGGGMHLDKPFDLVNLGELEETIAQLGLPYGDRITGVTETTPTPRKWTEEDPLVFDISNFIVPLFMFLSNGEFDADFQLTVIDLDGASTTETIKLGVRQ